MPRMSAPRGASGRRTSKQAGIRLLRLNSGVANELRELRELGADVRRKFGRRAAARVEALARDLVAKLFRADDLHRGGVEAIHDLDGRAGRSQQAEPCAYLESLEPRFAERRHVGQERRT